MPILIRKILVIFSNLKYLLLIACKKKLECLWAFFTHLRFRQLGAVFLRPLIFHKLTPNSLTVSRISLLVFASSAKMRSYLIVLLFCATVVPNFLCDSDFSKCESVYRPEQPNWKFWLWIPILKCGILAIFQPLCFYF